MRLRSQLVLFFGLVMGLLAAALVGLTQHQTRTNLLTEIREQMASGRFEAHQNDVLKQLALLSFRVVERTHEDHIRFAITREEWRDRGHLLVARFLSPRVDEH